MSDTPSFEEFERLWKSRAPSNVTIKKNMISVTVSPNYQVLDVTVHDQGLDDDQRVALQDDIVKAVNEAIQTAVLAAARSFDGLTPPSEIDSIKAALKKDVESRHC